jgi:hypothetical protein
MGDLQERLSKLAKVEQHERFRALLIRIDQLIQTIQINTFRIYDEDLKSIKEHSVQAAANELVTVITEARKLQKELEG